MINKYIADDETIIKGDTLVLRGTDRDYVKKEGNISLKFPLMGRSPCTP